MSDVPQSRKETEGTPLLPVGGVDEWRRYLDQWEREVYQPLFAPRGIGKDAALMCWFVNRLRNAIPDDDAGNEPWRGNG